MTRLVPLLLLATVGGCRAAERAAPRTPASVVAASAAARAPLHARCDVDRSREFPEWDAWARETLHENELLTLEPVKNLSGERLADAERMLRRGLEACDFRAPIAAMEAKARALVPDLRDLLDGANVSASVVSRDAPMFRLMVVNALTELDGDTDYAPYLVPLLSHPTDRVRMGAAFHARKHKLSSMRAPLLACVRDDPKAAVRRQAAESLFILADVRPPFVHGHRGLVDAIDADEPQARARAARLVERLIDQRTAAPAPPAE